MKDILTNNLYFGWVLTLVTFEIGSLIRKRFGELANPLVIAMLLCIFFLQVFNIPFENYMKGGDMVVMFINLATVILAVPLYRNRQIVKKYFVPIILGSLVGILVSFTSIVVMAKMMHLDQEILLSLLPKSITNALGVPLSEQIGGIVSITVIAIIGTGLFGAIVAPTLMKTIRVHSEVARGIAIGGASHVVGTSKALEMSELTGVISSLSMVMTGLLTVLLLPILLRFVS